MNTFEHKAEMVVTVNGQMQAWQVEPDERLLDTLRRYGYTEVKEGCGGGECGACTILLDGKPVCSCMMFTRQVQDAHIMTSKGVAAETPELLESMLTHSAVQCGFCTPGVMVSAAHVIASNKHVTREEIKEGLEGNICRCTGYHRIIDAVEDAAGKRENQGELAHYGHGEIKVRP